MSWSEYLYYYHQKVGGQFLGDSVSDGELILTYRDQPLVVRNVDVSQGRYTGHVIRARTVVALEKPYRLSIGGKGHLSAGVNVALNVLDRGLDRIPKAPDVGGDYGFPEVTRDRLIRTNNRPFTKQVLGNLELRNALLAMPRASLTVEKGPAGSDLHLVEVTAGDPDAAGGNWTTGDDVYFGEITDWEARRRQAEEAFFPQMDRLVELVKAAQNALTAWRM